MSRPRVKYDEKRELWYSRGYLGKNAVTGRKIRPYREFPDATDEASAQAMSDEWWDALTPTGSNGVGYTFPELCTLYIDDRELNDFEPSTVDTYRSIVRAQITPYMSKVDPRHVTPYEVTQFKAALLKPKSAGGRELSHNSVLKTLSFLKNAFKWMVKNGFADVNPIYEVDKPKREENVARSLTPDEIPLLMAAIDEQLAKVPTDDPDDRKLVCAALGALIALHNATRIGETCALRYQSFNLITRDVRIDRTASETKSAGFDDKDPKYRSAGTIKADDETIEAVRISRRQLEGVGVKVSAESHPISLDGTMLRPSDLRRWFNALLELAGLPDDVVFHTLRHTHATLLLAQGFDMKTVSERLRHKDVATTMRTYAHVMPGRDAAAAEAFSKAAKEFKL